MILWISAGANSAVAAKLALRLHPDATLMKVRKDERRTTMWTIEKINNLAAKLEVAGCDELASIVARTGDMLTRMKHVGPQKGITTEMFLRAIAWVAPYYRIVPLLLDAAERIQCPGLETLAVRAAIQGVESLLVALLAEATEPQQALVGALKALPFLGELSPEQYQARAKALQAIARTAWQALAEIAAQIIRAAREQEEDARSQVEQVLRLIELVWRDVSNERRASWIGIVLEPFASVIEAMA